MKTHHYIIAGATTYLLFLLLLTPAATVISFLNIPEKTVSLNGITGSVWSGQVAEATIKKQSVEAISWSLNPLSLFTGNVSTELQATVFENQVDGNLNYSYINNATTLYDISSYIKAENLQKLLNLPFGELAGSIKLDLNEIIIKPKALPSIAGDIRWKNAQLTLSEKISFGDILLTITPDDQGNLIGKLSNTKGQLIIKGDIKVTPKSIYTLRLTLKPRANASSELISILKLVAPRKVKDEHVLNKSGHLRQLGIKL